MNRRYLLLAGLLLVAACSTTAVYRSPDAGMVELEPLLAAEIAEDGVRIRVLSTGCTAKEDMAFFVERDGERASVAFGRRKPDRCKAAPQPMDLSFTWAELGLRPGQPVAVINPLAARR